MDKIYKFTKDAYVLFSDKKVAPKGFTFEHDIRKNGYMININGCKLDLLDALQNGHVEEILPDKKPISSEENTNIEEDIYSKKYNIYEILTLIPNIPKNTEFECSLDEDIWVISNDDLTLNKKGYCGFILESVYSLKEILEATYTIVKPIEEVKEKWVEIETHKDLCTAIVNKKMVRLGDGKASNNYNDKQIENLFRALEHGVFKIEYLEEN